MTEVSAAPSAPGYAASKQDVLVRLRRIEGQVRGLARMVEEDTYCIDVLTQVASVTKALQRVGLGLLDEHMHHCVAAAVEADEDEGRARVDPAKIDEAMRAVERLLRT
jgi:DNA-binding FrmR family transcriptional regulator